MSRRFPGTTRVALTASAVLWRLAASLLVFLAVDAVVFRTGWYFRWLEPNSAAAEVEAHIQWLQHTPHAGSEVIVLGDSRVAHGLSVPLADAASKHRVHFWNFGIPMTLPRDWYYILRDSDPDRTRFSAVVLALDQYSDADVPVPWRNRIEDLNLLIGRLRLSDCWGFSWSMQSRRNQRHALEGCLVKGFALKNDVQDMIQTWPQRFKRAKDFRQHRLEEVNQFAGVAGDLTGLDADWQHHIIIYPPNVDQVGRSLIEATVMPALSPYTGETTRYRLLWLGKIFDFYKNSSTRVVLLQLPRAPLPRPESPAPSEFLEKALPRTGVIELDRFIFADLEQPEYFFDGLHLNRVGRRIFSERLGREIQALLDSRPPQ